MSRLPSSSAAQRPCRARTGRAVRIVTAVLMLATALLGGSTVARATPPAGSSDTHQWRGVAALLPAEEPGRPATWYLFTPDAEFRLSGQVQSLVTGQEFTIAGTQIEGRSGPEVVVTGATAVGQAGGEAPTNLSVQSRSVVVVGVDVDGDGRDVTPATFGEASARALVGEADQFFDRSTQGQYRFAFQAWLPWQAAPAGTDGCDFLSVSRIAAARVMAAGLPGRPNVVAYTDNGRGCGKAGEGLIGVPSVVMYGYPNSDALAHELGHNLGLYHSASVTCGSGPVTRCPLGATTGYPGFAEYGDTEDLMGYVYGGSAATIAPLSPVHLQRLGVLLPAEVLTLDSVPAVARDVTIRQLLSPGSAVRAVHVTIDGADTYLAMRTPGKVGSFLNSRNYSVRPNPYPLMPGTAYGGDLGITVTVLSQNDVSATIRISADPNRPPATAPGTPSVEWILAGDGQVSVNFRPPASDGGAPITNYEYSIDNGATWAARAPSSTISPMMITGLLNGTTYQIAIRAVNAVGPGLPSLTLAATPYAPPGAVFVPVDPARVLDTRTSSGGAGPLASGETRVVQVADQIGPGGRRDVVPPGALAIAYNLTVPGGGSTGHLRVMPGNALQSPSSAINFRAGQPIANGLVVKTGAETPGGDPRRIRIANGASGPCDAVVDIVGYFVDETVASGIEKSQGKFTPVNPTRVYDSDADPAGGPLGPLQTRTVPVATQPKELGTAGAVVPPGASAVTYNITVVDPGGPGHLRVFPGDQESSNTSAINWAGSGERIANGLSARVDAATRIKVYNAAGVPVRFLIDITGYYSAAGTLFHPTDPERVLDTRISAGGAGPIANGLDGQRTASVATALVSGAEQVPPGSTAIAYNLTVTNTTAPGHLRVFPAGSPLATASTINWPGPGYSRANGTVVGISADREVSLYNGSTSPTDALVDTLGYYK